MRSNSNRAWMEISRSALRHNLDFLTSLFKTRLCPVLKANAYGHGATLIGGELSKYGLDMCAVATVAEGVELRDAGLTNPILVLSEPSEEEFDYLTGLEMTPTLYSFEIVNQFENYLAKKKLGDFNVHVKIDTGMHRLGVMTKDFDKLFQLIKQSKVLRIGGIYSHFATAGTNSEFFKKQLEEYGRIIQLFNVSNHTSLHMANSAAALLNRNSHFSMIRAGITLYGLSPLNPNDLPGNEMDFGDFEMQSQLVTNLAKLKPVGCLKSRILMIKELKAGECVSYSATPVERDCRIAIIAIGYSDGYFKNMSDVGAEVLVKGRRFPLIGSVTMDYSMVNLGNDEFSKSISPGDTVVLFGREGDNEISPWELANLVGTIAYEIITSPHGRIERKLVD